MDMTSGSDLRCGFDSMLYVADTFPTGGRSTLMVMEPLSLADPVIHPSAFVAATARVYGSVEIGAGAVVMFGAVLRAELERIVIGEESNLQDNVVVHADPGFPTIVGRRVTVGHAAVIHGANDWRPMPRGNRGSRSQRLRTRRRFLVGRRLGPPRGPDHPALDHGSRDAGETHPGAP